MIVRIWKGKMVDSYYFSGQVWDIKRQLWITATGRFNTEDEARMALEKVKMNICPRIPPASPTGSACEPIGEADRTGGVKRAVCSSLSLATALRACSSVPWAST